MNYSEYFSTNINLQILKQIKHSKPKVLTVRNHVTNLNKLQLQSAQRSLNSVGAIHSNLEIPMSVN